MAKQVTMEDIAAELKVSKSLVSRALSGKYGVSDETRSSIMLTAIRMGYRLPDAPPKGMNRVESITVAVEQHDLLDTGFWVKIINGAEKALNNRGISMFLSVFQPDKEDMVPLSIRQMKSSGILLLGQIPMKHLMTVSTARLPIVLVDPATSTLKYDQVLANNYRGAYEAAALLVKHGHRRIGFVGSTAYSFSFYERCRGVEACLAEQKEPEYQFIPITGQHDDFFIPFSRQQLREAMEGSHHPTALVCANDVTAFQVYGILEELSLRIPEDVSVIGFDNVEKCEWVRPALTSVSIPKNEMGERAVELLLKRIEYPDRNEETVLLGTRIIKRGSVLPLNG